MAFDDFLDLNIFFDYLWVILAIYILVAIIVSFSLFYNWHQYTGHRSAGFRMWQTTFLVGMVFFVMLATAFYFKI